MVGLGEYNIHERFDPFKSYGTIECGLRSILRFDGAIIFIKAYAEKCTYPDHIIKRLRALRVEIIIVAHKIDVQEKGSQVVDGYILREILA